jgi:two-component system, OmpR family, response regulator VicR
MKARILYVEDDDTLGFLTKDSLELHGYGVAQYPDGRQALDAFCQESFDICILDIMLPEMDGFALAEAIRSRNAAVPILFLSARSLKEDRLKGLRLGADDYIVKPFSIEELLLKIDIFLKRRNIGQEQQPKTTLLTLGSFEFDYTNLVLKQQGKTTDLTQREADLLQILCSTPNQVVKREALLLKLWGNDDYFMGRSLDVFISRLRKILKSDPSLSIENVHGVGFRLNMPA